MLAFLPYKDRRTADATRLSRASMAHQCFGGLVRGTRRIPFNALWEIIAPLLTYCLMLLR